LVVSKVLSLVSDKLIPVLLLCSVTVFLFLSHAEVEARA
jgi:hypothetical protein